ncbi:MAG: CBS domain-containing protein [Nevskiaceae bacterium]|nr:MAG: CBS domain-containing protein [Nevskiaceae bacterium]TBR73956.1 MAG: CBS domain-containing protein [Nevskiaceae bacterium]
MTDEKDRKVPGNRADRATVRTQGSTDALPVAPALGASLDAADMPLHSTLASRRTVMISLIAVVLGVLAGEIARGLMLLINIITDLCFYGDVSLAFGYGSLHRGDVLMPTTEHIGAWVIVMPAIGGLIAGIMATARWGSRAIQGHGIPEAMERILLHESNIPPRVTWLKPISAAFTIGTGGPFGAEGPIISTGGSLGSLIGQLLRVTADERKTLLAAGAAAGMAAVFGAPVASLVMAVELLLFEFRPRSLIPVALAAVTATGVRYAAFGPHAVFEMPTVAEPNLLALACYIVIGGIVGYASIWVTKAVFFIEDVFGKTHIHWMWWPAIGGLIAGVIGYFFPRTMGVGYDQIDAIVSGNLAVTTLAALCIFKFLAWSIALGSNTSGGTLAPLFITGGSMGSLIGIGIAALAPSFGIDPRIAGVVGMAAIFAGSARAMLTAVVFCFETTRQPATLLPLLGGGAIAYLISALYMQNTIMTEKIIDRGVRVPSEFEADFLEQITAGDACSKDVVSLRTTETVEEARRYMRSNGPHSNHQGFPVVDADGHPRGILTRREVMDSSVAPTTLLGALFRRSLIAVREDDTLRAAADHMVEHNIGRLIVVARNDPKKMVGLLTRHDVLSAHARRLHEEQDRAQQLHLRYRRKHADTHGD